MDKPALHRALCELIESEVARATEAAERTREGAIHEEAKPENDKDTRALEASYLARGQAQRVVDLQQALQQIKFMPLRDFGPDDAIDIAALIEVETEGETATRWYWLTPAGGGRTLQLGATAVDVVTPQAPLGRALVGRYVGDEITLRSAGRARELVIARVH